MKLKLKSATGLAIILIVIGAVFRLVPHPWNFAPVGAIALYGGAMLGRRTAFVVPMLVMLLSDVLLGFYFLPLMASVYLCFGATVLIGRWIRRGVNVRRVLTGSLAASLLFFLVTNFTGWAFGHGHIPGVGTLSESYINAIPFFRNTVLSDLFYSGIFFGSTALAWAWQRRNQHQGTPTISTL